MTRREDDEGRRGRDCPPVGDQSVIIPSQQPGVRAGAHIAATDDDRSGVGDVGSGGSSCWTISATKTHTRCTPYTP